MVKKSRDTVPLIAGTLNTIGTVPVVNTITKHVKMIKNIFFYQIVPVRWAHENHRNCRGMRGWEGEGVWCGGRGGVG